MSSTNLYAVYLRKSRADLEAEARGEGETLARHKKTLYDIAKRMQISIAAEYKEIVSGESIAARPQMQKLLNDVTEGMYDGVLVMEIERLARGNTIDQGIVAQAFKDSNTKIITPIKVYDPNNEYDEEYFEFSLFMSRREYKTIRRRMEAGRLAAIKEGNFIISSPPYGYKKTNPAPKIHTLEVVPEEAEVIKLIYDMYVNQHFGKRKIATALNSMGIKPPRSDWWEGISIRKILCNPVYMGYNQWHSKSNGDTLYKGLHEPIISKELYEQAQERRINRKTSSTTSENTLKNYYSGLLYCGSCGKCMQRRTIERPSGIKIEHMVCRTTKCNTVSSRTDIIDEAVLTALKVHLAQLKNKSSGINNNNTQNENTIDVISMIKSEICDLKKQKNKLHDLLEREIYDENTYLERQSIVAQKLKEAEKALSNAEKITTQKISDEQAIINIELLLENFSSADPLQKKELLSNVVRRIEYSKTSDLRGIHNKKESNMTIKCFFI